MSLKQQVTDLHLSEGLNSREIEDRLGRQLRLSSIVRYLHDLRRTMTEEQHEQVDAIKRARPKCSPKRTTHARSPLSPFHIRIGRKILWDREVRGMDPEEYAAMVGFCNRQSLREMELGLYDFRLSDLLQIAEKLNTDFDALVTPPQPSRGDQMCR